MSNNNENIKNVTNKSKLNNRTLGLKRWLSFMVALSMVMSLIILPEITVGAAATDYTGSYSGGTGTEAKPYLISTAEDLQNFVLDKRSNADNLIYYKIINDIGTSSSPVALTKYMENLYGELDGSGFTITVNSKYYLVNNLYGTIKNLNIAGSIRYGSAFVYQTEKYSIIQDCANYANLTHFSASSGIASDNNGTILRCANYGNITVSGSDAPYASGIAFSKFSTGTIDSCYNRGTLTVTNTGTGSVATYGISRFNQGTIKNCYNTADVDCAIVSTDASHTATNCYSLYGDVSKGGTIATEADLKNADSAVFKDLNSNGNYTIDSSVNNGYPSFKTGATISGVSSYTKAKTDAAFNLGQSINSGAALSYSSSDTAIAAVDASGNVTIKGAGKVYIKVSAPGTDNYGSACKFVTVTINTTYSGGYGTQNSPYLLKTAEDLKDFVNDTRSAEDNPIYYKVANDIGSSSSPVALTNSMENLYGELDGGDYTITVSSLGRYGLIYNLYGTIKNLIISGNLKDRDCVFAYNVKSGGIIQDCANYANFTSSNSAASSIAYNNYGTILRCANYGNITLSYNSNYPIGAAGIAYSNHATIDSCYNRGTLTATNTGTGGTRTYGISRNNSLIKNCYNTADTDCAIISTDTRGTVTSSYSLYGDVSKGGTIATAADLKNANSAVFADLNGSGNYVIDSSQNDGYPILISGHYSGGYGTQNRPYLISTAEDLQNFVLDTSDSADNPKYYKIINDIGSASEPVALTRCKSNLYGKLDGGGHMITINGSGSYIGLVGSLYGTIKNLSIAGSITYTDSVSSFAHTVQPGSVIQDCTNYVNIDTSGTWGSGAGIAFTNNGTILRCANYGNLTSVKDKVAGIAVNNKNGIINSCYNRGTLKGSSNYYMFGITQSGTIKNCYNTANLKYGISGTNDSDSAYPASCYTLYGNTKSGIAIATEADLKNANSAAFKGLNSSGNYMIDSSQNDGYPILTSGNYSGGDGSQSSPYLISTAEDLQSFVESESDSSANPKYYKVINNIGTDSAPVALTQSKANLYGELDGGGYTITINGSGEYSCLVRQLYGTIKNLNIAGSIDDESSWAAAFTFHISADSIIQDCANYANIVVSGPVFGISNTNNGVILRCANYGNLTGKNNVYGIVGSNYDNSVIDSCFNRGALTSTDGKTFGISYNRIPKSCYNTANATYGISLAGDVTNCYSLYGDVSTGGKFATEDDLKNSKSAVFADLNGSGYYVVDSKVNDGYPSFAAGEGQIPNWGGDSRFTKNYGDETFNLGQTISSGAKLSYSSSNTGVADVDSDGNVTIKSIGNATITVEAPANGYYIAASRNVTIAVNPSKPGAPTIEATSGEDRQSTITWTVPESNGGYALTGYILQRSEDGTNFQTVAQPSSIDTRYVDKGLTNGKTYSYRMVAQNSVGASDFSNVATAKPYKVPEVPQDLTAKTEGQHSIKLAWSKWDDGGDDISSYNIKVYSDAEYKNEITSSVNVGEVANNSVVIDGLEKGTTYYFTLSATNRAGTCAISKVHETTSMPPNAPTGLSAEVASETEIKLTWTAPENNGGEAVTSYNVYYREKAAEGETANEWTKAGDTAELTYVVGELKPGTLYEFKVTAMNGSNAEDESPDSAVIEIIPAKEPIAPVIGELISGNASIEITSVEVSDNFGDAVNKYSIYVSRRNEDGSFGEYTKLSEVDTETDSSSNILASGLENGVTYKVKVTASNNFGESEFSNEQEVLVGVPLAPKNMQAIPQKGQQIEFSFDPADGQGTPIYEYQIRIEGEKEGEPITPITDIIKVDTAKSSNERITYSYDARDYINGDTLTATVIARSVVADSVESNPATAAIGSPSAPVIEALTADENGIDLSWTESESNGNAKRYYQVTIAEENGSNSKNIQTANSTTKSMRIDNGDGEKQYSFEAGKTYNVYVLCHNSAGDGPISNVVSFTFGAPQPPVIDPPDMGDGELTVKWSAPESNGGAEIIGYNIYLNADTDPTMYVTWKEVKPETTETPEGTENTNNTETETPAEQKVTYQLYVNDFRNSNGEVAYGNGQDNLDKFEVVIGGLANGYSYDVTVTAVNTNGEGPGKPIEKPITPATKADAPRDLNAKAKSASEVDVTWNAPLKDGGTPVDGYYVTAKKIAYMNDDYTYTEIDEASRTEVYAEFITTGTQTSITGLDKASRYEITAAAHTAAGYSDDAIINVETHSKPTKPVITELISGVGDAESLPLTVYWEAPESDGGSPILGYDIYINNENHRGYKMNTAGLIPADKTEYKIEDYRIKRGTTYSVSVIAYNAVTGGSMVNGVSSDPMSITLGTVPAPKDVKVTGTLNGDLNVTWPMEQYAGIENYILRYVIYVNDVAATTTTTNSATLTLIPPGEPQKVQVAVVSSFMQEGLKSEPVTVTIGAPEKVTNVTATAIENGTTITWDKDPYLTDDDISNDGFAATKYNFYVDGKKVDTVKAEDISVYTKDIVGLTAGKEYKITVTGENDYGESVVSDAATVTPYAKPEAPVVKDIKSNVKGFSFTFEEPESLGAAITGYKVFVDGAEAKAKIDKDEETGVITATVNDLENGDTHGFYVIAINDKGLESEAPENAYTVVIGVPTAPDKVSAEPGVGSAVITFSKSADVSEDHKTTRYEVLQSGITQPVATVEADGSETYSATVSGLTDRTEYSFSVRAVNDIGEGPASSEVKVTPGTPKAPVISDIVSGNGSLEVKWNAPESNSGSITMYTVYVNDIALKNTVETSINIDGLTNGKAYNVCVTATNYCGESVKSDIETATPGTTSKAVGEIKAVPGYDENGCNITLTWNAPADNGGLPIESYIVESADGSGTITVDSANRTAVITNLEVGTAYSFTITPVNNAGNGEAKSTGEINTLSAPAAPTLIGADGSNKRVTATWSATNDELAPITGYVVYAKQVDVGENEEPVVLKLEVNAEDVIPNSDGEMSASIVDGVKEGYRYDVTVTAVNAIGESVASNSTRVTVNGVTVPTKPGAPVDLKAVAGDKSVTLTWKAPVFDGNSTIRKYYIWAGNSKDDMGRVEEVDGYTFTCTVTKSNGAELKNGQEYFFKVRAVNDVNAEGGEFSETISATPVEFTAPSAPTWLDFNNENGTSAYETNAQGNELTFYWNASESDPKFGQVTYTVYIDGNAVGSTTDTSFTYKISDEGMQQNIKYNVQVRAANENKVESQSTFIRAYRGLNIRKGSAGEGYDYPDQYANGIYAYIDADYDGVEDITASVPTPAPTPAKPSAPQEFKVEPSGNDAILTWFAPAYNGDADIEKYKISVSYVSAEGRDSDERVLGVDEVTNGGAALLALTDEEASNGNSGECGYTYTVQGGRYYDFGVSAINANEVEGDVATATLNTLTPPTTIGKPDGLTAEVQENLTDVKLTWNPVSGAESYELYVNGMPVAEIAVADLTANDDGTVSYTFTGEVNNIYRIAISAKKGSVESNPSSSIIVDTHETKPEVPQNVQLTAADNMLVTWEAPSNADQVNIAGYNVQVNGVTIKDGDNDLLINDLSYVAADTVQTMLVSVRAVTTLGTTSDWAETVLYQLNPPNFDFDTPAVPNSLKGELQNADDGILKKEDNIIITWAATEPYTEHTEATVAYNVYIYAEEGANPEDSIVANNITDTTLTYTLPSAGRPYVIEVESIAANGKVGPKATTVVQVPANEYSVTPVTTLAAQLSDDKTTATLTWDNVIDADVYYLVVNGVKQDTPVTSPCTWTLDSTVTNHSFVVLSAKTYSDGYEKVADINESNEATVNTGGGDDPNPGTDYSSNKPVIIQYISNGLTNAAASKVFWKAPEPKQNENGTISEYKVYEVNNGTETPIGTVAANASSLEQSITFAAVTDVKTIKIEACKTVEGVLIPASDVEIKVSPSCNVVDGSTYENPTVPVDDSKISSPDNNFDGQPDPIDVENTFTITGKANANGLDIKVVDEFTNELKATKVEYGEADADGNFAFIATFNADSLAASATTYSVVVTRAAYTKYTVTGVPKDKLNALEVNNAEIYAGDLNKDNAINSFDLIILEANMVSLTGNITVEEGDLTGDNELNSFDSIILISNDGSESKNITFEELIGRQ